jgi:hypothetical protein
LGEAAAKGCRSALRKKKPEIFGCFTGKCYLCANIAKKRQA